MNLKLYQIDAFADKLFAGNPAAVVPLEKWPDDSLMQNIAMENNLAESAFFIPNGNEFDIRWFTPAAEINLCGHATLASAYVLFNHYGYSKPSITFNSKSGPLYITRNKELYYLDFPSWMPERVEQYPETLIPSLGNPEILGVYKYRDYVVELHDEAAVRKIKPDFALMKETGQMVMVTAPGAASDFVCRFFAPTMGIDEDPVTGSAFTQLTPFWAQKLGKRQMRAKQLSRRGGDVHCELRGDRVIMGGKCVFFMEATITV
jgi:predicted PhzF superfamily epimerase YddE/YHI9